MSRIDHHHPRYPDLFGQFRKSYHLEMVSDKQRTSAILRALRRALNPETVFCELGCGTGIFSIYAASRCKKVYAIERDPAIALVARKNIQQSRYGHKIELIEGDALQMTLPEKVDVIFCEMMSIWCIEEPQIPVYNHARQELLKPGGLFLPSKIINLAELGYFHFEFEEIKMEAAIPLFTGIPQPSIMTERRVCKKLDFTDPIDLDLSCDVHLEAIGEGTINCAKLTSIVQMGPQTVFGGSDSLMPKTIVPVKEAIEIKDNARVRFRAAVRARDEIDEPTFAVTIT